MSILELQDVGAERDSPLLSLGASIYGWEWAQDAGGWIWE